MARLMRSVGVRITVLKTGVGKGKAGLHRPKNLQIMSESVEEHVEVGDDVGNGGGDAERTVEERTTRSGKTHGKAATKGPKGKSIKKPNQPTRTSPRKAVKKNASKRSSVKASKSSQRSTPSPQSRSRSPRTPVKKRHGTPKGTPKKGTPKKGKSKSGSGSSTPCKSAVIWDIEKEEEMVRKWKENEFLYNLRHADYRDSRKKEITLQRIAGELDCTGMYCLILKVL